MAVAMEKGYTKDQTIELLKVYALFAIDGAIEKQKGRGSTSENLCHVVKNGYRVTS